MKLKESIELAAAMLNLDGVGGKTQSDKDKLLLKCANCCLDEIACEYLPLRAEKEVEATDGKIPYSLLAESVLDVVEVLSNGVKVNFELTPSYIKVENGTYTVVYCTRPDILEAEDEVPFILRLTPRTLAYGIAAEYLLMGGFYDEAVTWDKRFKDALIRSAYGSSEKRVKTRRWLI